MDLDNNFCHHGDYDLDRDTVIRSVEFISSDWNYDSKLGYAYVTLTVTVSVFCNNHDFEYDMTQNETVSFVN